MTAHAGGLTVDGERLLSRLDRLRRVGATAAGGVTRLAFTPEDVQGRRLVAGFMTEAGLRVRLDAAANLLGERPGQRAGLPVLVVGSHRDTVVNGGAYDGAYGVVAAIEVAQALAEHGLRLDHPLVVVAFNNEEGAFGTRGMWGAHALAGLLPVEELAETDNRGMRLAELLRAVGGDPGRIREAAWQPGSIAAYLELHIEQGPVLDREGVPIGVVEAITGRRNVEVVVCGEANHAGTTPMDHRRDALVAAAQVVLAVRELAAVVRVATVGTCAVAPNVWNVVPGEVRLGAELRDTTQVAIDRGLARLHQDAARVAAATGTRVEVRAGYAVAPVPCDPRLRDLLAWAAGSVGLRHRRLPSGAGHDAQIVASIAPVGMVFVPSRGGISHAPGEATDPDQLTQGANVLLQALLACDGRPTTPAWAAPTDGRQRQPPAGPPVGR